MNSQAFAPFAALKENPMFSALFGKRRIRRSHYQWKPAIDLSNPRIAAALATFPTNY
ncbi:hypothetical protein [Roseibium marinum]|nr:hypothetical protein [Roseibium marinum]